jgi:hypothetical protein
MNMPKHKNKPEDQNGGNNQIKLAIPKLILDNLNEHTVGGFALFFFDSKDGKPTQILTFDNPIYALALSKHIETWVQTVDNLNLQLSMRNIMGELGGDSDSENE